MYRFIRHCVIPIILLALPAVIYGQAGAEVPAAVPAIDEKQLTRGSYASQSVQWENVVASDASNEDAWLNLYKAKRFESYTSHSRKINSGKQEELNQILSRMEAAIPDSYAFHYARYLNGNKSDDSFVHLRAAYKAHSGLPELWDDMLCDAVLNKDEAAIAVFASRLSGAGVYDSHEVEYNRNVLNSIEQNGILVTNGNVDTYPLILMQKLQGFRTDVTIVCLDWLNSNRYREYLSTLFREKPSDLQGIVKGKSSRSVYLALTIPPDQLRDYAGDLYCTGLAMKYSRKKLDNLSSLSYNWENLFAKNLLDGTHQINRNYLLPMLMLVDYYRQLGRNSEAEDVRSKAIVLANAFGVQENIGKKLD